MCVCVCVCVCVCDAGKRKKQSTRLIFWLKQPPQSEAPHCGYTLTSWLPRSLALSRWGERKETQTEGMRGNCAVLRYFLYLCYALLTKICMGNAKKTVTAPE